MNTKNRVKNFWKFFTHIKTEVEEAYKQKDENLIKQLKKEISLQLESVCNIGCEIEYQDGFFELEMHCSMNKTKQLITLLIKENTPQEFYEDWKINSYRPPLSEMALNTVVEINQKRLTGNDFVVYYEIDKNLKSLHLTIVNEELFQLEKNKQYQIIYELLELYIGEIELEARISSIDIKPNLVNEIENFCTLPNLYEDICDIVIDEGWTNYCDPTEIYQALKIDEDLKSDSLRKDMKMIITSNLALYQDFFNKENTNIAEAKEFGSEYGFLYYQIQHEKEDIALVRQQLESECNNLFYPISVAKTLGGAIGTNYAYIDLIVYDRSTFNLLLEKLNTYLSFPIFYKSF